MTAAEAQALAASAGQPNPQAINAQAQRFRNEIKVAAGKGLHALKFSDVSPLRLAVTAEEMDAAKQLLVADGYAVDAVGISWGGS